MDSLIIWSDSGSGKEVCLRVCDVVLRSRKCTVRNRIIREHCSRVWYHLTGLDQREQMTDFVASLVDSGTE